MDRGSVKGDKVMDSAAQLGLTEVLDTEGRTVRLGRFWEDKPVVLVVVRHFG